MLLLLSFRETLVLLGVKPEVAQNVFPVQDPLGLAGRMDLEKFGKGFQE